MKDYIKLSDYKIEFKQLISGPAPVGRILNYLKLIGGSALKHKNGNRNLQLQDNIGSAWATEFMCGLGLCYYIDDNKSLVFSLYLTKSGKALFDLIRNHDDFDESSDPEPCKIELMQYSEKAYNLFFEIFKSSPVCINLCAYLINHQNNEYPRQTFYDEYFDFFNNYYCGISNTGSRRNAGFNRVPSVVQLCQFFNCLLKKNNNIIFDVEKLNTKNSLYIFKPITFDVMAKLQQETILHDVMVNDLINKYGIDGTVAREIITRNSSVQNLFRNNLIAKYGCKCAICNKEIEDVLVASHIKPASLSNVVEKADCENGLLLCALHDKLFDRYLISFDFMMGELIYCDELKDKLEEYQLYKGMKLEERYMTNERKKYLLHHNIEFKAKNK